MSIAAVNNNHYSDIQLPVVELKDFPIAGHRLLVTDESSTS